MRWMTKREVERAAAKGPLAALDNSIAKWEQMRDAPAEELKAKLTATEDFDGTDYCAMCVYATGCINCPLITALDLHCADAGHGDYGSAAYFWTKEAAPITPVHKAIRTLIKNMKKARKILKEQENA